LAAAQRPALRGPSQRHGLRWCQPALDWFYIPVGAPLPLEFLFDPGIHVHEPLDRTKQPARQ